MIVNRQVGLLATIFALAWLASCGGSSSSGGGSGSAGRNAYVAVPEANAIAAYRVDSNSGNLNRVLGSPFPGGTSPVAIAIHPSGNYIYAANQGSSDVSLFKINHDTGELAEVMPRTPAGLNPSAIMLSTGGDLLFVANQTANSVSVYSVTSGTGSLASVAGSPFTVGSGPSSMVVDPTEHFLYVANFISNTVSGMSI